MNYLRLGLAELFSLWIDLLFYSKLSIKLAVLLLSEFQCTTPYHFQRIFSEWAGISPKRFLQYLTVEYAKAKIAETKSLLNLTGDVGLSSPGRLHDLFVTLEAMSPG